MAEPRQALTPYAPWRLVGSGILAAMPPEAAKVLLALAAHDNLDRNVFPGRPAIAKECSLCIKTVDRSIRWLEDRGMIRVTRRKNQTSKYIILQVPQGNGVALPAPQVATCDATTKPPAVTPPQPHPAAPPTPLRLPTNGNAGTGMHGTCMQQTGKRVVSASLRHAAEKKPEALSPSEQMRKALAEKKAREELQARADDAWALIPGDEQMRLMIEHLVAEGCSKDQATVFLKSRAQFAPSWFVAAQAAVGQSGEAS